MNNIMFMGTPEISAICLDRLIKDGHGICAVISREDKPRGRGNVMTPTPTKALALENNIPVYTPKTLKDEEFMSILEKHNPEIIVVVAYGKILPKAVLDYPRLGCVNLHVSLLPKYRGAAPMQRAIMNGEKQTGVTVMYMEEGLDTGDVIEVSKFDILPEDDFEAIHDRSAEVGGKLLSETIEKIYSGAATRTKQDDALATYAAKVEKEDCKVDFTKSAKELDFIIRGVTPIPGAFAYHNGKMLKINKATPINKKGKPGEVIELSDKGDGYIVIACGEGALQVSRLIPEGKGKMSAGDFVRGRKIALGDILE